MEINKILTRIGIDKSKDEIDINFENLKKLQEAYLLNVPYENLDFIFGNEFSVNIMRIYEKIIENNRGGICYESNTLFMYLLKSLGYKVHMIFAKVEDLTYIASAYPHLALLVKIDEKEYLVDVGNGQNVREPMALDNEEFISVSEHREYKLVSESKNYSLLFNHRHEGWQVRYTFNTDEVTVSDFKGVFSDENNYEQFSNHAPLLVTKALKSGRITLTDELMSYKDKDEKRVWNISLENRAEVLRDYFGIIVYDEKDKL